MASAQVNVRVLDGAAVIAEAARRPIRLTPDGYAGVTFGGAVYPLLEGNVIDLTSASWEIEDCNRFLLSGSDIPYAQAAHESRRPLEGFGGEWNVESNRFGHYVVFNASERVAADLVETLEAADLPVQRWDVSHRAADDGKFYDWFARLRFVGTHDECVAAVAAALSGSAATISPIVEQLDSDLRMSDLEAQIERLVDRVSTLEAANAAAAAESATLRERLVRSADSEAQLTAELDRAIEHQRTTHGQLEALRSSAAAPDMSAILQAQTDNEELLELALAENADLNAALREMKVQAEGDQAQVRQLNEALIDLAERLEEVGEQEDERRRASRTRRGPRVGVEGFVASAFPRLEFVYESLEVLANFESPGVAMGVLHKLERGDVVGKTVVTARGWREVDKVATGISGSEDLGRIYYKPVDGRVLVSVHVKQDDKQQQRHLQRLSKL